jgi:glyceraldehyde 3-phosphate dehydrogenase
MTRVAVNGFGRIGRGFVRAVTARPGIVDVVAVNDTNDTDILAYLLEHDTVHGQFPVDVAARGDLLALGDCEIVLTHEPDPADLPWHELDVDVVIEATGRFTHADSAASHLKAGARRVVISAPATGADITICMGVNHRRFDPDRHTVVSNASCTTNCLAVLALVLHRNFGLLDGFMSTVHAYTNDQNLLDLPHRGHTRDLRRARAAAQNIVPSTTGAARAIGEVLPELAGRLDGMAFRLERLANERGGLLFVLDNEYPHSSDTSGGRKGRQCASSRWTRGDGSCAHVHGELSFAVSLQYLSRPSIKRA